MITNVYIYICMMCSPHVAIAQYAQKHPVHREEISIHCQTDSQISAVQSMKDAVCMTKDMLEAIDVRFLL